MWQSMILRWRVPTRKGWPVGSKDLHFQVRTDGKLLGVLLVSKGTIAWRPRHGLRGQELQIPWERFGRSMQGQERAWKPARDIRGLVAASGAVDELSSPTSFTHSEMPVLRRAALRLVAHPHRH